MRAFNPISAKDPDTQQLQRNLVEFFGPLSNNILLNDNNLLRNISLTTGSNTIYHGLGRRPNFVFFNAKNGVLANFATNQVDNIMPEKTLIINSSTDVTVDILCL